MCTYSNLPDDIIYDLCITAVDIKSLKELSAVDRRTRRIATPVLFRDVSYHAITTHGSPWKIFLESVEALLCAQEVSVAVRRFRLTSCIHPAHEHPVPGAVLGKVLYGFPNLMEMHLVLQYEYRASTQIPLDISTIVNAADEGKTLKLLSLHSVTLPSPAWLVRLAPLFTNLRSLEIVHRDSSPNNAYIDGRTNMDYKDLWKLFRNLKRLHTGDPPITAVVQEIAKYFMLVEDLGLFGDLGVHDKGRCILDHLHNFTHLPLLHSLSLADESKLGLGFYWFHSEDDTAEVKEKWRQAALQRLLDGVETTLIQGGKISGPYKFQQLAVGGGTKQRGDVGTIYTKNEEGKLIPLEEGC